ncbi:MAG TPA: DNA polymerase IV [Acidimicrobiia bacterium]|nr:DNA polymerase IV [Acidimicrobiia bacterium]
MTRDAASILHVDLDAFFASVEQLLDPTLRGRPVVVGGLGPRGVVSAASYEARRFGVHSAMPTARARRLAPDAVFLPPRFEHYEESSTQVMAVLRSVTPLVEQLSIDEAFVDVGGVRRRHGDGPTVARALRARIRAETGLVASIGVATTKFLAKLASDLAKPDGLLVVAPGTELAFLAPLPVTRLWGVGPATLRKLERIGVHTIGDVASLDEAVVVRAVGRAAGQHLHALARNVDDREVVPERATKSIGAEETFPRDLHDPDDLAREIVRLADKVSARLRRAELATRTITLKARYADFETHTHARTLAEPTALSTVIVRTAHELLARVDHARGIRLLGISGSNLVPPSAVQAALDLGEAADTTSAREARDERREQVERAVAGLRERFGDGAVRPASLVTPDRKDHER